MTDWKKCTNKIASNERIQNIQNYCTTTSSSIKNAPIDIFYKERNKILRLCNDMELLENNEVLGPLLYVGIISATENYVRDIFSKCINICSICKREITEHAVSAGSIIWQQGNFVERSIFENISFSDGAQIKKELKKCLKIAIKETGLLWTLLEEFDKMCQIRHAIVHSSRLLAGKNAIKMNIPPSSTWVTVKVSYAEIQECASICTSMIREMNTFLFGEMARRWAIEWKKDDFWNDIREKKTFDDLWDTFFSQVDAEDTDFETLSKIKCKNAIKKAYDIV